MNTTNVTLSLVEIDKHFPCDELDGCDVKASPDAEYLAFKTLGIPSADWPTTKLEWHLPNVFDVRYGSSYVATARLNDRAVRFLVDDGEFLEGDDKV